METAAPANTLSSRPEPSRNGAIGAAEGSAVLHASDPADQTLDYGTMPVAEPSPSLTPESTSLALPPIEDSASIQLALIDVLQALAANQLDPKRAGLLLYGLQVASTNAKDLHIHSNVVRSITYTEDGIPLAPQDYGWDIEDMEDDEDEDEPDEE